MPKTLAEKLYLKAGEKLLVIHLPAALGQLLSVLPEGAELHQRPTAAPYGKSLACCQQRTDVELTWPELVAATNLHGAIWLAYPKKTGKINNDLSREGVWETVKELDPEWLPVAQIALDDTWSALRFRFREDIPRLTRRF